VLGRLLTLTLLAGMASAQTALAQTSSTPRVSTSASLLVLGDSLSAEYGLARGQGWVALLEQRLARERLSIQVVNASISGETTSGGRSRLAALLDQHRPAVVIIELGGNDALRGLPLTMTESNLLEMVKRCASSGARVLLVGMRVPPNYGKAYAEDFEAMFARIAKREKVAWVPFFLQGIADAPDSEKWFQADRIHPSASAHPRMLDNLWPALRPLLRQSTGG
jgi:acyl-CoA thioesterase-1